MKRELVLGILYDLSLTIGGEVSLTPLIRKTLQKLLQHTGYPTGLVFMRRHNQEYAEHEYALTSVIGDKDALTHLEESVKLPPELLSDKVEVIQTNGFLAHIPCNQERYNYILRLPLGKAGVILLLSPQSRFNELPLEEMLTSVLNQLKRAISLCELNDEQKEILKQQVEARTKKIAEREEQMALLLASTAEGIFGLNQDGICTFANASALKVLGYDEHHALVGEKIHDILHHTKPSGDPFPAEECPIALAMKSGEPLYMPHDLFWHKDGHAIPVEYNALPIKKGEESIGQIVTFTDITERLQAEKKKQTDREKLEHTQRLESLGVLSGGIAHDFNNLLTAILGNTTLVQQRMNRESDDYDLLNQVVAASESAADLCKQMLAYSGKGKFTVAPINLTDLVHKMAKLLEVSIHKRSMVRFDLKQNLPSIDGDLAQIQQVVMNLITNANEALEEQSGMITIATGTQRIDQEYLETTHFMEDVEHGDYVYIEVTDTGCGMTKEQQSKMFEPFFTTKVTGRGLGMSAMLGIVRGHKGTLKVYSEVGRGTAIKVMFPVSEKAAVSQELATEGPLDGKGKTILVIDDEDMLRKVSSAMLKRLGFEVLVAEDGQAGIDVYTENKGLIDIILLDMMMPGLSGEETFQKLRLINPEVKVLLTSGYNEQEATQRFTGKGLAGFIQKPYRTQSLSEALDNVLRGNQ